VLLGVTKTTKLLERVERILLPKPLCGVGRVGESELSDIGDDDMFLFGLCGADMVTLHLQTRALVRCTPKR
jgi:hypothetical protein